MLYSKVLHQARKQLKLSCNDFCIADEIDLLSSPSSPVPGWCTKGRGKMAEDMDLSRQSVITIIQKLVEKKLVVENEDHHLQTTPLWKDTISHYETLISEPTKKSEPLSSFLTPDPEQGCQESLQGVKKLDSEALEGVKKVDTSCKESLHQDCQVSLQGGVKKLDTYINRDINSNEINTKRVDDVDVENARASADSSFEHLGAEKEKKGTPSCAPPLKKPIYGDGVLQHDVRQYYRDNPVKYPTEMVPAFLDWYTEIMQNSLRNRESDIGKERWRTLDTWNLRKKLDKWHTNFLNDKRKANESATAQKNTQLISNSPRRSSGPTVGSSPATKRAATVKPGMFDRDGSPSRNTHSDSGLTTIRIDVDPDHQTAGDQT